MKVTELFNTTNVFNSAKDNLDKPWVCLTEDNNIVHFSCDESVGDGVSLRCVESGEQILLVDLSTEPETEYWIGNETVTIPAGTYLFVQGSQTLFHDITTATFENAGQQITVEDSNDIAFGSQHVGKTFTITVAYEDIKQ